MSEVVRTSNVPAWPTYPAWRNGPWPNRRRPPVSEDDLVSVFGVPVKSIAEHENVGWYEAHVMLESDAIPPFRVFVQHHTVVDPPRGENETADWWPESDRADTLEALGDEAYVTASGGVVCRSGVRWTAGVLPLSKEHTLPPAECRALLDLVLVAVSEQGVINRSQTFNAGRHYSGYAAAKVYQSQQRRERRRAALLSGVPPHELDAWLDDWHARRRVSAAKRVLFVAPILAVLSALSNTGQWLENFAGMLLVCAIVAVVVWGCLGAGHPRKYKQGLREQTWP